MHYIEYNATRRRLPRTLAAAALGAAGLFLLPAANAQMTPPQARPQAQSPQTKSPQAQSPSPTISDEKLNAAAAAIGHVTSIRQNYERKISEASPSDKQRLTEEANNALEKAVTDQGLSVDEYNSIIRTAQNDPAVRQKLAQRIPHSGQ
jgi:predicted ATPase with chaperone activity